VAPCSAPLTEREYGVARPPMTMPGSGPRVSIAQESIANFSGVSFETQATGPRSTIAPAACTGSVPRIPSRVSS
jgi:hypothetical protein